jgi:hypothetical protein
MGRRGWSLPVLVGETEMSNVDLFNALLSVAGLVLGVAALMSTGTRRK